MNMGQSSALIARQHRPEVRTQCRMLHPVGYCSLQISQLAAAVVGPGGNMPGLHALTLHQLSDRVGQLYLATCSGLSVLQQIEDACREHVPPDHSQIRRCLITGRLFHNPAHQSMLARLQVNTVHVPHAVLADQLFRHRLHQDLCMAAGPVARGGSSTTRLVRACWPGCRPTPCTSTAPYWLTSSSGTGSTKICAWPPVSTKRRVICCRSFSVPRCSTSTSGSSTAKGSLPTTGRAQYTAWPRPSARPWRTAVTFSCGGAISRSTCSSSCLPRRSSSASSS